MDDRRTCAGCGEPLPAGSRPNRSHHDGACRVRALRSRRREAEAVVPGLPPEVAEALERATAEPRLVALVAKAAGHGNWRAASWMLERRWPERWAPRRREIEPEPRTTPDPFAEVDE